MFSQTSSTALCCSGSSRTVIGPIIPTLPAPPFLPPPLSLSSPSAPNNNPNNPSIPSPASGTLGTIERLDPALDAILPKEAKLEILVKDLDWAEGPVWSAADNCL